MKIETLEVLQKKSLITYSYYIIVLGVLKE